MNLIVTLKDQSRCTVKNAVLLEPPCKNMPFFTVKGHNYTGYYNIDVVDIISIEAE